MKKVVVFGDYTSSWEAMDGWRLVIVDFKEGRCNK